MLSAEVSGGGGVSGRRDMSSPVHLSDQHQHQHHQASSSMSSSSSSSTAQDRSLSHGQPHSMTTEQGGSRLQQQQQLHVQQQLQYQGAIKGTSAVNPSTSPSLSSSSLPSYQQQHSGPGGGGGGEGGGEHGSSYANASSYYSSSATTTAAATANAAKPTPHTQESGGDNTSLAASAATAAAAAAIIPAGAGGEGGGPSYQQETRQETYAEKVRSNTYPLPPPPSHEDSGGLSGSEASHDASSLHQAMSSATAARSKKGTSRSKVPKGKMKLSLDEVLEGNVASCTLVTSKGNIINFKFNMDYDKPQEMFNNFVSCFFLRGREGGREGERFTAHVHELSFNY